MLPVIITPNSINLLLDGRMRTISQSHMNFAAVKSIVQALPLAPPSHVDDLLKTLKDLVDIPAFIAKVTEGRVKIGDHGVMFDNEVVHGVISTRLVSLLNDGFDVRPLSRFLQRLKTNPLTTAIDEMYLWLESGSLPITDDGCFLAFKLVEEDFSSGHRNPDGTKLYNCPGSVVEMPGGRDAVDPDRSASCSTGLHFCSWQYLPSFGINRDGTKVVVLKIAPEDVIAIPYDYNNSKGRAWRYVVLREVPKDECEHLFNETPVVDSYGFYDNSDDDAEVFRTDTVYFDDPYEYLGEDENFPEDTIEDWDADCACHDGVDGTEDVVDNDAEEEVETFTFQPPGKKRLKMITGDEVKQMVADYGQRGMSRITGIPRTTIQEWLKRIN